MSNANAWDDDWTSRADKPAPKSVPSAPPKKLSQAERRAQHAAFQKELWDTADNPAPAPMFLAVKEDTPLQGDFKPAMKLLSRKPPPKLAAKGGVSSKMGNMTLEDEDSEEERRKEAEAVFKERQAKAILEREEKQRRYDQRRAELLGTASTSEDSQGRASPNNRQSRGKGKGRGQHQRNSEASSSADQSPARNGPPKKSGPLFEPSYSPKPNSVYVQRRAGEDGRSRPATPGDQQQQPIRSPRNPDGSGRGGFGFSPRGNKSGNNV